MAGETVITVVGNLTADPELRFTQRAPGRRLHCGRHPAHLRPAAGEWKDGDPLFLRCSVWRQPAENAAEPDRRQGSLSGGLRQRSFETRDGEKRTVVELDVDEIGASLRYATAKVNKNSRTGRRQGGGVAASGVPPRPGPTTTRGARLRPREPAPRRTTSRRSQQLPLRPGHLMAGPQASLMPRWSAAPLDHAARRPTPTPHPADPRPAHDRPKEKSRDHPARRNPARPGRRRHPGDRRRLHRSPRRLHHHPPRAQRARAAAGRAGRVDVPGPAAAARAGHPGPVRPPRAPLTGSAAPGTPRPRTDHRKDFVKRITTTTAAVSAATAGAAAAALVLLTRHRRSAPTIHTIRRTPTAVLGEYQAPTHVWARAGDAAGPGPLHPGSDHDLGGG